MNFLVEEASWNDDTPKFVAALQELGLPYKLTKYIDVHQPDHNHFNDNDVMFFGSLGLARWLQRKKGLTPGPIANFEDLKCSNYYPYWGKFLWNHKYLMIPYQELKRSWYNVVDMMYIDKGRETSYEGWELFVRPDDGFKTFTGQVFTNYSKNDFFEYLDSISVRANTLCIVASVKKPHKEYRLFVNQRNVITGSLYKEDGQIKEDSLVPIHITEYVENILKLITTFPDDLFVIDVAEGHNKELGILELNSYSCSGVYSSNVKLIILEVIKIGVQRQSEG